MLNKTYKQEILSYFFSMDIDQLRYFLKDEYTYSETTKEIFLNEIESVFEAHRNSGDTELLLYPGVCNGKTCENCGKQGYRFVGNNSKNYTDLIFEIEGDDITDIYSCGEFKSEPEISGLNTKASIFINLDDRVSFPKSASYWARVYAAQDAYGELITAPPRKLSFDEMRYWLNKHAELYHRLGGYEVFKPHLRWTPFLMLYSDLNELVSFILDNLDEIRQANQSIIDITTEEELIEWVLKYETVFDTATMGLICMADKDSEDLYYDKRNPYFPEGEPFKEIVHFLKCYMSANDKLLRKYSIYTSEEKSELYSFENSDMDVPDLYSLRFHLEQREELEKAGVHLPFYLLKKR